MGFTSYLCLECGMSVYNSQSVNEIQYISNVVVVLHDGETIKGFYNGYGRVAGIEIIPHNASRKEFVQHLHTKEEFTKSWERAQARVDSGEREERTIWYREWEREDLANFVEKRPAVYHECCFDENKHSEYKGGSESCPDQGHFVSSETIFGRVKNNEVFKKNYKEFYKTDFKDSYGVKLENKEFDYCEKGDHYFNKGAKVIHEVRLEDLELDICNDCAQFADERIRAYVRVSRQ